MRKNEMYQVERGKNAELRDNENKNAHERPFRVALGTRFIFHNLLQIIF